MNGPQGRLKNRNRASSLVRIPKQNLELSVIQKKGDESDRSSIAGDIELLMDNQDRFIQSVESRQKYPFDITSSMKAQRANYSGSKYQRRDSWSVSKAYDSKKEPPSEYKVNFEHMHSSSKLKLKPMTANKTAKPTMVKLEIDPHHRLRKKPLKAKHNASEEKEGGLEGLSNIDLIGVAKRDFNELMLKRPELMKAKPSEEPERNSFALNQSDSRKIKKNEAEEVPDVLAQLENRKQNSKFRMEDVVTQVIRKVQEEFLERFIMSHCRQTTALEDDLEAEVMVEQKKSSSQEQPSGINSLNPANMFGIEDFHFDDRVLSEPAVTPFGIVDWIDALIHTDQLSFSQEKISKFAQRLNMAITMCFRRRGIMRFKLSYQMPYMGSKNIQNIIDTLLGSGVVREGLTANTDVRNYSFNEKLFTIIIRSLGFEPRKNKLKGKESGQFSLKEINVTANGNQTISKYHQNQHGWGPKLQIKQIDCTNMSYPPGKMQHLRILMVNKYQLHRETHSQLERAKYTCKNAESYPSTLKIQIEEDHPTQRQIMPEICNQTPNPAVQPPNHSLNWLLQDNQTPPATTQAHMKRERHSMGELRNNNQSAKSFKNKVARTLSVAETHQQVKEYQVAKEKNQTLGVNDSSLEMLDFSQRVSLFFMRSNPSTENTIELYHWMKFLLMDSRQPGVSDPLSLFFDSLEATYIFKLMNQKPMMIKMSAYRVKSVYAQNLDLFFKFELQEKELRTKMVKFIATGHDLSSFVCGNEVFESKESLLSCLVRLAEALVTKKSLIYHTIGLQNVNNDRFYLINCFELQSKDASEHRRFLIPRLKVLQILCQKSTRISYGKNSQYAVITVIKLQGADLLHISLYLPKIQRTLSFELQKNVVDYIPEPDLKNIIQHLNGSTRDERLYNFFESTGRASLEAWGKLIKLLRFRVDKSVEENLLLVEIGGYTAFVKDSSISQHFEFKDSIVFIEMSISKITSAPPIKAKFHSKKREALNPVQGHQGPEASEQGNKLATKDKTSLISPSYLQSTLACENRIQVCTKNDLLQPIQNVYQSQASKYILYVKIIRTEEIQPKKYINHLDSHSAFKTSNTRNLVGYDCPKDKASRINIAFYLTDLIQELKRLSMHSTLGQKDFNEANFKHAILLTALERLKKVVIHQLKLQPKLDELFSKPSQQAHLREAVRRQFAVEKCSNRLSLNDSKCSIAQSQCFLLDRRILNIEAKKVSCIFYFQPSRELLCFVSVNRNFKTYCKIIQIEGSPIPFVETFKLENYRSSNKRLFKFYRNMLRLI